MSNKVPHAKALSTLYLGGLLALAVWPIPASAVNTNNAALNALFDQANYWHDHAHNNLATEALKKILLVEPNNTQALYLLALWSQQAGNHKEAVQWRERLSQASPQAPELQELDAAQKTQQLPQGQLSLARQQAYNGNITDALTTWKKLFNDGPPPLDLAPEYYLTMAGDRTLYPQAVSELRRLTAQYPQAQSLHLTLAKVLTYNESSRREGLDILATMPNSKDADNALRQALLWLGVKPGDEKYYQAYLQRYPQDSAVQTYFQNKQKIFATDDGYNQLNQGNWDNASAEFTNVLKNDPNNADALAGMGYAAIRQGDYISAAQYLNRAAAQGGDKAALRKTQAEDATFYNQLAIAKHEQQQGDIDKAIATVTPLAASSGEHGLAAKLLLATLLRQNKNYADAEKTLRTTLNEYPNNPSVRENLYYVLRDQNNNTEAQALLRTLPASLQTRLQPRNGNNPAEPIRRQAQQAIKAGNTPLAISILRQGLTRVPNDPWLRLDLARALKNSGDMAEATAVMAPAFRVGASHDELYAAALFASENQGWQQTQTLLSRIPAARQNADIRVLAQRANYNLQIDSAQRYLAQDNKTAAANTLRGLAANPPENPLDAGKLAQMLTQSGDLATAVSVVRHNMQNGVQGNAGDYAAQIAVLNQAGLNDEAQAWLSNPTLLQRSTPVQLANVRESAVINDADRLRLQGNYAAAYDKLLGALQQDPQNTALMFAMARLYQSGKMNKEAGVVYNYLLNNDNANQDARIGAINIALADGNIERARQLSLGLHQNNSSQSLLLLARVEEAQNNHQQALSYLRRARAGLVGLQTSEGNQNITIGELAISDNPFISTNTSDKTKTDSVYGVVMPWQTESASNGSVSPTNAGTATSVTDATLRQVNEMISQLVEKTASWAKSDIAVRSRNGESGLSQLTEVQTPLQWSTVPFGDSRLDINVTPITLDAGSTSSNASYRFGTGALIAGQIAKTLYDTSTTTPPTKPNLDQITLPSQGAQKESGVEVSMALKGNDYKLDIGSTPLAQNLNTIVGGLQWSPQLNNYLKMIVTGERRAVTDSLLSYVGAYDNYSGKQWGQVTKNGANLQLSYDNNDAGFYVGAGAYSYIGHSVPTNSNITGTMGFYLRPYRNDEKELKTGVNITYMNFEKNLSNFSYGQGGYFSPQNYVSVAFPVDYTQKYNNWDLSLGASFGYQSYSQNSSPYFPSDDTLQSHLEEYVTQGLAKEAYYPASSENGFGYNLRANIGYQLNKDLRVGGQVGYDTFGSYNESTAKVWLRYLLGDN